MKYFSTPFWGSLLYNSFGVVDSAIAAIVLVALFRSRAFRAEMDKIKTTLSAKPVAASEVSDTEIKEEAEANG